MGAARISVAQWELSPDSLLYFIVTAAGTFGGGYLVGSILMGLYLLISLNVFGRHSNEAFSSLRNQDYKNLSQTAHRPESKLTVFPVGIDRVPRHWVENTAASDGARLVPIDGEQLVARLIEEPIILDVGNKS